MLIVQQTDEMNEKAQKFHGERDARRHLSRAFIVVCGRLSLFGPLCLAAAQLLRAR